MYNKERQNVPCLWWVYLTAAVPGISYGHVNSYFLTNWTDYLFTTSAWAHTKAISLIVGKYNMGKELYMDSSNNSSMLDLWRRIIWGFYVTIKEKETLILMVQCSNWSVLVSYIDSHSHINGLSHPHSPHITRATTMQSILKHETYHSAYNATFLTSSPQKYAIYAIINT